jgi:CelD/BcsL family acetyltransferase involved in cellulose biosynthesis
MIEGVAESGRAAMKEPPSANSAGETDGAPGADLVVERFDLTRAAEWDGLVREFSEATFFHASAWMRVLQRSYGFRPVALVFRKAGNVVGLVPMVEVLSRLTGRRGVSLPFADECAPLTLPGAPLGSLRAAVIRQARERRWDFFELRGSSDALRPNPPSVSFYGHLIEIPSNERALWENLRGPVRTAVRKAKSSGVTVEFSKTAAALGEFHRLYCLTRRRHGLPPQPFTFFESILDDVFQAGLGQVALARSGGRCVAGAVFFQYGRRALFKYGAFDVRYQAVRANNLIFWEALQRYQAAGCSRLDLGRTSLANAGLRRFKEGWATREYAIDYVKYDLHGDRFVKEKDMASGWYNWAFRLAPRWASSLAGKVLYKHWA